jgi:hypothetical protein
MLAILIVIFVICLSAHNYAVAECFTAETGKYPSRVQFDSGADLTQVSVSGEVLSYHSLDNQGQDISLRVHAMNFVLETRSSTGGARKYEWVKELPNIADLTTGAVFDNVGSVVGLDSRPFQIHVEVLGTDQVVVDGCTYDVLVIFSRTGSEERPETIGTRWMDPYTQLTYRADVQAFREDGSINARFAYVVHME